ncbi:MAG: hypothetical protein J3K34DRAFT_398725 [Monoraphidium minutum]|nr:MAG: hypothetical protein J3K34DRAFT_398725 [Monoraphidium minutum]
MALRARAFSAQQTGRTGSTRMVVVPAAPSSSSRARSVQVHAAKGKGRFRQSVASPQQMQSQIMQNVPPVDPENEEFVIFIRATSGSYQQWMNMSVVKGGSSANLLVRGMTSEWGRRLYSRTLLGNVAASIYKERDVIIKGLRDSVRQQMSMGAPRTMQPLLNVPSTDFEFAMKIRDKANPKDWAKPENLTVLPPESEVISQPLDRFKAFFSPDNIATLFKQ